jgi:hypothetical protein
MSGLRSDQQAFEQKQMMPTKMKQRSLPRLINLRPHYRVNLNLFFPLAKRIGSWL